MIISQFAKPLSISTPSLKSNLKNPNHRIRCYTERGHEFDTGDSFFRRESATARDLSVLSAALYKQSKGTLRVLDAMCGCGIRSLRYLLESEADFVWINDGNDDNRRVILSNLSRIDRVNEGGERRFVVTHLDANRVLAEAYLREEHFDLIDVDSFGSNAYFLRLSFDALKFDGLLYVTCTDGYTARGHRPQRSLASYGAYVRHIPYSNEVGLRMLIGGAVRDASSMGYRVAPLFSYYSHHGPVFRVMLRVNRGKLPINRHYGFISYCNQCGHSQEYSWDELGHICCPCNNNKDSRWPVVSGPLWTGPLHDATYVKEMLNLAGEWGWIGNGTGMELEKLLNQMIDESDPRLPLGYLTLDEVAKRAKASTPSFNSMMSAFHKEGYAACRTHMEVNAIKTNCPMQVCIRFAKELRALHIDSTAI